MKELRLSDSLFRIRTGDVILNWGNSHGHPSDPDLDTGTYINRPDRLEMASNKLKCFGRLSGSGIQTIPWTQNHDLATAWYREGSVVYCRRNLTGHSGQGIEVVVPDSARDDTYPVHEAPLYTQAIGFIKRHEYRVHVVGQEAIFVQKKKRKDGWEEDPNYSSAIRNHHTGWIYSHLDLVVPESVTAIAIASVAALGLDFGAVDIIYFQDQPYVLEVNTAPGLEGTTLDKYSEALYNMINERLRA